MHFKFVPRHCVCLFFATEFCIVYEQKINRFPVAKEEKKTGRMFCIHHLIQSNLSSDLAKQISTRLKSEAFDLDICIFCRFDCERKKNYKISKAPFLTMVSGWPH